MVRPITSPESPMTLPIILFASAAAGGMLLAFFRLSNRPLPMPLALLHGALAAGGLVALVLVVAGGGPVQARIALGIFLVAALGGFFLLSFHLRKKELPVPVVIVHGLAALAAFVVLVLGAAAAG